MSSVEVTIVTTQTIEPFAGPRPVFARRRARLLIGTSLLVLADLSAPTFAQAQSSLPPVTVDAP
ncbi:MAG: hypothetical protein JWR89_854, partial [Tardiphaga sp.]|nr:hypothetical protein [Tardiphaga sp.]